MLFPDAAGLPSMLAGVSRVAPLPLPGVCLPVCLLCCLDGPEPPLMFPFGGLYGMVSAPFELPGASVMLIAHPEGLRRFDAVSLCQWMYLYEVVTTDTLKRIEMQDHYNQMFTDVQV